MDIRECADRLNTWLLGREGKRLRVKLRSAKQEIVLYDERLQSGYRKIHLISEEGLVSDFFVATQPSERGQNTLVRNDFIFPLTDMWETGEYASLEALEAAVMEKLEEKVVT